MIFLIGGCSFCGAGDTPEGLNGGWPSYLERKLNVNSESDNKVINLSEGASGNDLITWKIMRALKYLLDFKRYNQEEIRVIVQWSQITRKDFFLNREDIVGFDDVIKGRPDHAADRTAEGFPYTPFYNRVRNDPPGHILEELGKVNKMDPTWLKSGGYMLDYGDVMSWRGEDKFETSEDYMESWYKYYYTFEKRFYDTLKNIFLIQSMCEKYKIKYAMTVWQNIFSESTYEYSGRQDIYKDKLVFHSKKNKIPTSLWIDKYPATKFMWDIIDWNNFLFFENDDVAYGGLGEYSVCNGFLLDSSNHPDYRAHKSWLYDFLIPKLNDRNFFDE
jgi:hypothetical protein